MQRTDLATQMVGHLLQPLFDGDVPVAQEPSESPHSHADYRLTRLLSREIGKRIFLGVELATESVVLIKLVLFGQDPLEDVENPLDPLSVELDLRSLDDAAVMLPYLDAFEVETPLGPALALVKPYPPTHPAILRIMSSRYPTTQHQSRSAVPASVSPHPQGPVNSQAQYSRSDLRLRITDQKFELHFQASRLQSGRRKAAIEDDWTAAFTPWLPIVLGTVIFVGGSVVTTGSVWVGMAVAVLLPVLYVHLVTPPVNLRERGVLRLTHESGGRTFLSLITLMNTKPSGPPYQALESTLHCSRKVVQAVKISPTFVLAPGKSPLQYQLYFTFYNPSEKGQTVRLVGSYAQVRWVCQHLTQWASDRPDGY